VGEDIHVSLVVNVPPADGATSGEASFFLGVSQGTAMPIFVIQRDLKFPLGEFQLRCVMDRVPLPRGQYSLWLSVFRVGRKRVNFPWRPIASFDVFGTPPSRPPRGVMVLSPVYVDSAWEVS
jgi:hypothetical protein